MLRRGGAWNLLGTFELEAGTGNRIVLNAAAADGTLVADAIRIVRAVAAGEIAYVHADHLGQPQKLTDATATLLWDRVALPFGATLSEAGLGETSLRFPGQWADAESGLHYNYFRDYDPSLGRYIQSDPISLAGGLNTYAYVGGNPLLRVDRLGLDYADTLSQGLVIWGTAAAADGPVIPAGDIAGAAIFSGMAAYALYQYCTEDDEDDFCYKRYKIELATCRALGRAERSHRVPMGSASRCYESAEKRLWACRNNQPEPPFHGWPQY